MLKFIISDDKQWLVLTQFPNDVEKKQIEISMTKKIHNHFFHPLVKKKIWDGNVCFIEKKGPFWRVPIGLWRELMQIGEEYKIEIEIDGLANIINQQLTLEEFTEWSNEFFADADKKPRDYQIEAAWKIIKYRYSVS